MRDLTAITFIYDQWILCLSQVNKNIKAYYANSHSMEQQVPNAALV